VELLSDALVEKQPYTCDEGTLTLKLAKANCKDPLVYGRLHKRFIQDPTAIKGRGQFRETYLFRCGAASDIKNSIEWSRGAIKPCLRYFHGNDQRDSALITLYMGIITTTCADGNYVNSVFQNNWDQKKFKSETLKSIWMNGICPDSIRQLKVHQSLKTRMEIFIQDLDAKYQGKDREHHLRWDAKDKQYVGTQTFLVEVVNQALIEWRCMNIRAQTEVTLKTPDLKLSEDEITQAVKVIPEFFCRGLTIPETNDLVEQESSQSPISISDDDDDDLLSSRPLSVSSSLSLSLSDVVVYNPFLSPSQREAAEAEAKAEAAKRQQKD
jgi:hypothetical protein